MSDLETEHAVEGEPVGGHLQVRAYDERRFKDLDGEDKTVKHEVGALSLEADPELAEALARELLAYVAEQADAPTPFDEGKPVHQQYAEAEPDFDADRPRHEGGPFG